MRLLGAGTQLDVLMANHPGDITMMGARNVAKSSPATTPSAYAGMAFTALNTCRILDSRPSQGGFGSWVAGSSNLVKIGPYSTAGGGYASGPGAQGGSSTSCGLDTLAGPGEVAVIMAAVSTVSQAGPGYLTFFPQGAPNPGTTSVSQWYQPGYVQTSFVLIPSDLVGTVAASAFTQRFDGRHHRRGGLFRGERRQHRAGALHREHREYPEGRDPVHSQLRHHQHVRRGKLRATSR